jgi:hypothetical protein
MTWTGEVEPGEPDPRARAKNERASDRFALGYRPLW